MTSAVLEMPLGATIPRQNRTTGLQERLTNAYDTLFVILQQQYILYEPQRVLHFLRKHSQLIPILQEGRSAVSYFFGDETKILLTLVRDSEIGQEYLEAWIQTDLPAKEAVERITELDDTWFSEKLEIAGDLLNFNLG